MTSLIAPLITSVPTLDLTALTARAMVLAENARAPNTRRVYRSNWDDFARWCMAHGFASLSAEPATVGVYLAAHETRLSVATLSRRLSAIAVPPARLASP